MGGIGIGRILAVGTEYSLLSTQYRWIKAGAITAMTVLFALASGSWAEHDNQTEQGTVPFVPTADEPRVAERFRLAKHDFEWQTRPLWMATENLETFEVTFPSPVTTVEE